MSDVKVTREHREAALAALGWSSAGDLEPWTTVGGDTFTRSNKFVGQYVTSMVEESAVALAIAQAEHRVRDAVISDLKSLVDNARYDFNGMPRTVDADSIELLIETLEAQNAG